MPKPRVLDTYGKLPVSFEVNQGQTDAEVTFLSRGNRYTLFLTATEAVLVLRTSTPPSILNNRDAVLKAEPPRPTDSSSTAQAPVVLRMKLVDANPSPKVTGLHELPGKANYFLGNDPKKWRSNVPPYAKVTYQEVYPGVELVYYGNQRQLEYDFVVAPGVDPALIKLAFEGADRLDLNAQGDLVLQTSGGAVRLHKPHIYQEVGGLKQPIDGEYVWRTLPLGEGPREGTYQIGFQVASYDTSKPLVIDPVLSYATYLGGSGNEEGSITVDAAGNAYVTGRTESTNFPTMNPLQSTHSGGSRDAFVTKVNASGSALVYATYLGGSGFDGGRSIAVDAGGNAYVTGATESTNFPITSGAFQGSFGGFLDGFVTKLNATGSTIVYSTYLGGSDLDHPSSIAVDTNGNAYVTGATLSTNFPTVNPLQATYGGGISDAFVAKISEGKISEGIEVTIDIKPGSFPNSINLGSRGNVPVAIFSTTTFDATKVDPTTVTLASAPVKLKGNGTPMASFQDVNGDTRLDLVVQVSTESFQLSETDTEAVLEGKTFGGTPIRGSDSVRIVP